MAIRWFTLGAAASAHVYLAEGQSDFCSGRLQSQCGGDCRWESGECHQICFREDTAYTGDMPGQPVTNVGSQELCRQRCENTVGCVHFTYYPGTRACHLQDDSASRQATVGAVSGEPDCRVAPTPGPATGFSSRSSGSGTGSSSAAVPAATAVSDGLVPRASGPGAAEWAAAESMPSSVGSAMAVGSVRASNSFSGLFLQASPRLRHVPHIVSTQVAAIVGGLTVLLVGALLLASWRQPDLQVAHSDAGAVE